jgi:hypothetical protein
LEEVKMSDKEIKTSDKVEYLGIFLTDEKDVWTSVYVYACKKNKHLFRIPEDESRRSLKQEGDMIVLKSGKCPVWNCW